ncbi:hypothetical protein HBB16_17565 [Pseudonocardia sp. MCCB 268]|nr:hypothetical protein [Pseudonocardia cytotoxica]
MKCYNGKPADPGHQQRSRGYRHRPGADPDHDQHLRQHHHGAVVAVPGKPDQSPSWPGTPT